MVGWPYCQRGYDRFVGTERYTFGISDITFWSKKSARFYLDAFSTEEDVVDAVTFVRQKRKCRNGISSFVWGIALIQKSRIIAYLSR